MSNTARLMELAKILGEWRPDATTEAAIKANDIWESLWQGPAQMRRDIDTVINSESKLAGLSAELDKKLAEITEYTSLFRDASPAERTAARKLFLENAKAINKTLFNAWKPKTEDFASALSLHLLALAASYGHSYPRETFPERDDKFSTFSAAARAKGLDWLDFVLDYNIMATDYIADLYDPSQIEAIDDENFATGIQKANQALSQEASADNYFQRGMLYMKHREFEMAVKDFERASLLDKKNPNILYQLGTSYAILGLLDAARGYYMNIMTRFWDFPHNAEIRAYLDDWRNRQRL